MGMTNSSPVDEWLTEDGLFLLESWARDYAMEDVAKKIGISNTSLSIWQKKYPEIKKALAKGREIIDYKVENALLKIALGYTAVETKTIIGGMPDTNGNRTVRVEKIEKEIAPNGVACLAWLNNRRPDLWKRNRDKVFELSDDQNNITVNIIKHDGPKKTEVESKEADEDWNVEEEPTSKQSNAKQSVAKVAPLKADDWDSDEDDWDRS